MSMLVEEAIGTLGEDGRYERRELQSERRHTRHRENLVLALLITPECVRTDVQEERSGPTPSLDALAPDWTYLYAGGRY